MRLIDANALKKDIDFQYICKCCHNVNGNVCDICLISEIETKIDNASTEPQVTVFAENVSKEEIEDFKQELENVLKRPQGEFSLEELKGWLTSCGYSSGTVEDKVNEFKRYIERSREE